MKITKEDAERYGEDFELFKTELREYLGIPEDHPKWDKLFDLAWFGLDGGPGWGGPGGYEHVVWNAKELKELLEDGE